MLYTMNQNIKLQTKRSSAVVNLFQQCSFQRDVNSIRYHIQISQRYTIQHLIKHTTNHSTNYQLMHLLTQVGKSVNGWCDYCYYNCYYSGRQYSMFAAKTVALRMNYNDSINQLLITTHELPFQSTHMKYITMWFRPSVKDALFLWTAISSNGLYN